MSDTSRERIVDAATRLFAEHGYDGTSTRQIAAEAGLNMATVNYHTGAKKELYVEVMRRAHQAERSALEMALAEFRATVPASPGAAVAGLVDRYLDFCLEHPQVPALWMRRWLSDADEVSELEADFARPLIESVREAVVSAFPTDEAPGADLEMTIWTVLWSTHGFCRSGILDGDAVRRGPGDKDAVERFRRHLRTLVLRDLGLPPQRRQVER
ncbi:TetR/AcrR family transcriptional regulator [Streptomyces mangrovisoli]|uniref:TetR family transcriptional regulator n=1 Tax=Streptomyces mangrovisoli TaxID=1428628 RepID=A0A1J4NZV2_9ACTN|nr:TetR/AcrR family transcriptional regulator [Streptomyces mangrovisoli]OIJ68023.1 TetR family transcriptional regulator [Streptomyces mangrovisoli]